MKLNVQDQTNGKPVAQLMISGFPYGFLKAQFVEQLPFRWDCIIPYSCYSEKGDRRVLYFAGPYAATLATRLRSDDNIYSIPFADFFRLGTGFLQLAQSHEWRGTVGARSYCTTHSEVDRYYVHREILRPISLSVVGQPFDIDPTRQIKLMPLTEHRISRMRYHLAVSANTLISGRSLDQAAHLPDLYDQVLGWAAPETQDAFENAVYVSLLGQAGTFDQPYPADAWNIRPKVGRAVQAH